MNTPRPWLPTTPGESAVAFTLTVLLLANTTVLLLLATGELGLSHQAPAHVADQVQPAWPRVEPVMAQSASAEPDVRAKPVQSDRPSKPVVPVKPLADVPVRRVFAEPVEPAAVVAPAVERDVVDREVVERDEPPAAFFGIPLD